MFRVSRVPVKWRFYFAKSNKSFILAARHVRVVLDDNRRDDIIHDRPLQLIFTPRTKQRAQRTTEWNFPNHTIRVCTRKSLRTHI